MAGATAHRPMGGASLMTATEIFPGIPLVFMALILDLIIQGSIVQYEERESPLPAARNTTTLPELLEVFAQTVRGVAAVLGDAELQAKLEESSS